MRQSVSEFGFECLVLFFQFRKMRLDGHRGSLLCEIPDLNILTEASRQVDARFVVRCVKSPQFAPHKDALRLDAKPLTRDTC